MSGVWKIPLTSKVGVFDDGAYLFPQMLESMHAWLFAWLDVRKPTPSCCILVYQNLLYTIYTHTFIYIVSDHELTGYWSCSLAPIFPAVPPLSYVLPNDYTDPPSFFVCHLGPLQLLLAEPQIRDRPKVTQTQTKKASRDQGAS